MLLEIAWSVGRFGGGFGSSESLFRMESRFDLLGASGGGAGVAAGGAGGAEKTELDRGSSRLGGDGLNDILLAREDTGAGARLLKPGESILLRAGLEDWKNPLGGDAGLASGIGFRSWSIPRGWLDGDRCAGGC